MRGLFYNVGGTTYPCQAAGMTGGGQSAGMHGGQTLKDLLPTRVSSSMKMNRIETGAMEGTQEGESLSPWDLGRPSCCLAQETSTQSIHKAKTARDNVHLPPKTPQTGRDTTRTSCADLGHAYL